MKLMRQTIKTIAAKEQIALKCVANSKSALIMDEIWQIRTGWQQLGFFRLRERQYLREQ